MKFLERVAGLFHQTGELKPGSGRVSGVIALSLALLCLLGVIAFHFPEYMSTPELRKQYSVDRLRQLMLVGLVISGGLSLANIILDRQRWLSATAFIVVLLAIAGGGPTVQIGQFPTDTPYIGMDWFILDLLGSTMVFVLLEKLFPLYREQPVFRFEWQTDFTHFIVNHFLVGVTLLIVNFLIHRFFGWAIYAPLQDTVQGLPFFVELFACLLAADLVQYWTHRAYHEVPFLWRFHAVHHSTKVMDWMAGSRLHLLEVVTTRVSILGVLYVLGFSKNVMDVYIIIVGFQAVLNHANVSLPWGPLKYLIVTPDFHHWHHSSDRAALDRNYAAHFAFIDYLFGTVAKTDRRFPEKYGVLGDYMPSGFVKQQLFPFTYREEDAAAPPADDRNQP
ncbi:MAG TPA: sterol desaturase family protein [Solimonas sp.]|nr:sterol desaturase family protein [Solimonas sp.]